MLAIPPLASRHDLQSASLGELVRDMMDWFAGREALRPPDERTMRRKVSAIWRELRPELRQQRTFNMPAMTAILRFA
jgi:hypothetical protein